MYLNVHWNANNAKAEVFWNTRISSVLLRQSPYHEKKLSLGLTNDTNDLAIQHLSIAFSSGKFDNRFEKQEEAQILFTNHVCAAGPV
jgi:hypothetical protein